MSIRNWTRKHLIFQVKRDASLVLPDLNRIPEGPGAYAVSLLNSEFKPVVIDRILKPDKEGALYIGTAPTILRRRLRQIGAGSHPDFSHKFRDIASRLTKRNGTVNLGIVWLCCPTDRDARHAEAEALDRYLDYFGELPPLNRAKPRTVSAA